MEKMNGYKGFDKNLKCRGFQFEIGGEYEEGEARTCHSGFHYCENPLDLFNYYSPADSRYTNAEGSGKLDKHSDDSKLACTHIRIGTEIGLLGIISAGVKFILDRVDWTNAKNTNTGNRSAATNTGYQSAATNTGNRSAATNTGYQSAATNTGYRSAATNTGNRSAATNTGDQSAATNTGNRSAATNTGYQSAATNTGDYSAASNTGDYSAASNTGDQSAATNTGDQSAATNTGNRSAATNTGNRSAATNTGNRSAATNTGYQSAATNTGNYSAASVEGKESVALAIGYQSKAKGALGCWIVLSDWQKDENDDWHIVDVKCSKIDGEKLKADNWYKLIDGEFIVDDE